MFATRTIVVDRDAPDRSILREAADVLIRGGLVAFATETVYGLGADATSEAAVRRIFAAKGRPSDNPLIVHVADLAMARRYAGRWPKAAQTLAEHGWPGPLTLVVPKTPQIPAIVTAGLDTVGLRIPAPAVARELIAHAGVPLAAPSANRSEHISPTTAAHVCDDLEGAIDWVLDSGPTDVGIESTVIDCCGATPTILRPGPIDEAALAAMLGTPPSRATPSGQPARSPGQRARHYAPKTPAIRIEHAAQLERHAVEPSDVLIAVGRPCPATAARQSTTLPTPSDAARELYATLRRFDAMRPRTIVVLMPPDEPSWDAIRDRLRRATVEPS